MPETDPETAQETHYKRETNQVYVRAGDRKIGQAKVGKVCDPRWSPSKEHCDLGEAVACMCESSLKTKGAQVAGSVLNTLPVFVIVPAAPHCLASGLLDKLCRHTTAAFRGDVKPILEREILEFPDRENEGRTLGWNRTKTF